MVLDKPEFKGEIREGARTDYGTPQPVMRVVFAQTHWRAAQATMLRLAAEVELLSIGEMWSVDASAGISILGADRGVDYQVGVIKLSLNDGTHAEAVQGLEVLFKAVAVLKKSETFRCMFQGGQAAEPTSWIRERERREKKAGVR